MRCLDNVMGRCLENSVGTSLQRVPNNHHKFSRANWSINPIHCMFFMTASISTTFYYLTVTLIPTVFLEEAAAIPGGLMHQRKGFKSV
jgi:hypothetical protein